MTDLPTMISAVFVVGALIAAIVIAVISVTADSRRKAAREAYFAQTYDSSVEHMLAECSVDRDHLRSLRDAGRGGLPAATRELLRSEPIPLRPAAEFIKRL